MSTSESAGSDRQIEASHALGEKCRDCGNAGGCVALAAAVRRRTAPPPMGGRVLDILLNMSRPVS